MTPLFRRFLPIALTLAVIGAVGYGVVALVSGAPQKTVTAYFPRTIGLYTDSSVRVLGVAIGKVTKITPMGTQVQVVMSYDANVKIPADAGAAIVPPSIVSDRYVQLTPPYTGGPVMPSGAVIPQNRTEVPLELDQIFADLNTLDVALGPSGANKNGALSKLIQVSAENLAGNGTRLHDTFTAVSQALTTLADNRGNLFQTLSYLQQFTTTLAQDNGGVIAVNNDLAQVSIQLNGERGDLAAALHDLAMALGQVQSFVGDNKAELTSDVTSLTSITQTLVNEKQSITEFLDDAPLALQNLSLTYDGKYHTLDTRSNENSGSGPTDLACQIFYALGVQQCPLAGSSGLPVSGTPDVVSGATALSQLMGVGP
ncbi:MAG: MCE family protein [Mycobacteriales bacterium]